MRCVSAALDVGLAGCDGTASVASPLQSGVKTLHSKILPFWAKVLPARRPPVKGTKISYSDKMETGSKLPNAGTGPEYGSRNMNAA